MTEKISATQRLVESALLIAMGVVLSLIKIIDLPYGGSVTIASMFPVMLIAYRHGLGFGLVSATVFGGIQQLLGLKTLSWVSTWQSVLAVILLDYIVAFAVIGLGGLFRGRFGKRADGQVSELLAGALLVCLLRYICHVISGATVWAGLSIPTRGAIAYSLAYNATYMIPETLVMCIVIYFVGSALDFRFVTPVRLARTNKNKVPVLELLAVGLVTAALIFDIVLVFGKLQNAETGNWYFTGLGQVNWVLLLVVTAAAIAAAVALILIARARQKKD
ncbi:MAG: energy-coupled thiamine transporter ThiT [Clostridia bacterium]|nr:energy-coupled thiamine transporter ThiT [Clostridia bacterium]MBR7062944.1 energy-coupled thiamine transporter ThiT [Clostridia bacterium]